MIDQANPAVASGTQRSMVNTGAGGADQNLLVHLAGPAVVNKNVALFLRHLVTTAGGTTGLDFSYSLQALTQDFDPNDDGVPAPRRNTWNTTPAGGGTMALNAAVDHVALTGTALDIITAAIDPGWFLSNFGFALIYGVRVRITNVTVYNAGTYSITTTAGFGLPGFSHVIPG